MSEQIDLSRETLRNLYEQQGLSQREIARRLDVSKSFIASRMKRYGIAPRSAHVPPQFDIQREDLYLLYHRQKKSQAEIASLYGCSQSLISLKMRKYGIPSRPQSEALLVARGHAHLLRDFDGTPVERAYYIGFCRGDVHVRKRSLGGRTLEASCGSSRPAQISLFRQLFAPYGHISQRSPDQRGRIWISASLNMSFAFLLDLRDEIPHWIREDKDAFCAFLAGYTDAEGSIWVSRGYAAIAWCSYDHNILHQIYDQLKQWGIAVPAPRIHCRKGYTNKYGIRYRQDYWSLKIAAQRTLLVLFDLLVPHLRHADRRQALDKARKAILERLGEQPPRESLRI